MAYGEEVSAFARVFCAFASDMLCEWRAPGSSVVAPCGMLDLDDFCAASHDD